MSGPDILSVGLDKLIVQAEATATQIAHAPALAGDDRLARGLRALGAELSDLAARAREVSELREVARRWAVAHTAAAEDEVRAIGDWKVELRALLQSTRRASPALAVEVDGLLALLDHRVRFVRPTLSWLTEAAPMLSSRAPAFATEAAGVLSEAMAQGEGFAATLAAHTRAADAATAQRSDRAAEAEALLLALREALRRTRLAWRVAARRLPGLPTLDLTTVAAAAGQRAARRPTSRAPDGTAGGQDAAPTARDCDATARDVDTMTRDLDVMGRDTDVCTRDAGSSAREPEDVARGANVPAREDGVTSC